ncbi:MAG: hypothetical protein LBC74_04035, partial [Planctomycetaceae bacterium]|nr:hypothetical protein [Planctomycetaceae bacterium]
MKKIVYLHYSIIIFFVTCITNHGICQSPIIPKTQSITTQKIINEISPFIDDDTAIICYVNLLAFNEVHKFDKILDQLPDKETFNNNIRQYLESIIKSPPIQNSKINQNIFSNLIENDITHLYFILNMKDLKFGPYFIFPNVQENTSKSKAIENFFGIENNTNGKLASTTWAVYQKNRMIIVGLHPILDFMKLIYYCPFEQYATMILFPALENSICGFNNISSIDKKKYINSRFKNFKSNDNRSFQLGMREVDDCNMIKLI